MTIQCQTWLSPDAAILKRKEEKGVEDRGSVWEKGWDCYTAGVMKPDNAVQAIQAARFSSLLPSSALLCTADSFSLQPQWRSFFRKQKAGGSVLNPRGRGRPAPCSRQEEVRASSPCSASRSPRDNSGAQAHTGWRQDTANTGCCWPGARTAQPPARQPFVTKHKDTHGHSSPMLKLPPASVTLAGKELPWIHAPFLSCTRCKVSLRKHPREKYPSKCHSQHNTKFLSLTLFIIFPSTSNFHIKVLANFSFT